MPRGEKKLLAGIRYSLLISGKEGKGHSYNCQECDEEDREARNCRNRKGLRHLLLQGEKEWCTVTEGLDHVLKIDDLKFFACPLSTITRRTWQLLDFINETTDDESTLIKHFPREGTILKQPIWFREAVRIVRTERNRHRREQHEKDLERAKQR